MLTLENDLLKIQIDPERGGRIDQVTDIKRNKNWLWHPQKKTSEGQSSVESQSQPELHWPLSLGANFDHHWLGGWDEIFPNDAQGRLGHRTLYDHGELWSQSWVVTDVDHARVNIQYQCQSIPVTVRKTVQIDLEKSEFSTELKFINHGNENIPYLYKSHPALVIEEGDHFLMPTCEIEPVDLGFSTLIGRNFKTHFPDAVGKTGEFIQLDRALAEGSHREFVYASNLNSGECGVCNPRTGSRIRFCFDRQILPFIWLFQSFGGFNGHYVAMLEPCTNKPYDLIKAMEAGTCALLGPSETATYTLKVVIDEDAKEELAAKSR